VNTPYQSPKLAAIHRKPDLLLGFGSLISLLAFLVLDLVYRKKLNLHREECRQRIAKLLKSRLGK